MVLRASDRILEKNLKIIRRNVGLLKEFMRKYGELFGWVPPKAGAIAFIKFNGPSADIFSEHAEGYNEFEYSHRKCLDSSASFDALQTGLI